MPKKRANHKALREAAMHEDDRLPGETFEDYAARLDEEEDTETDGPKRKRVLVKPQRISEYYDPHMGCD